LLKNNYSSILKNQIGIIKTIKIIKNFSTISTTVYGGFTKNFLMKKKNFLSTWKTK